MDILLLPAAVLFLVLLHIFLHWSNTALQVSFYTVCSDRLPDSFDGFKIVQISDLHNTAFGKDNRRLLEKLRAQKPDMIAVTGDIIHAEPMDTALAFAREAVKIAPVYFVPGNHEHRMDYEALYAGLRAAGVTVLTDRCVSVRKDSERIRIAGVEDPVFRPDVTMEEKLLPLTGAGCTVLLSHRPEYFDAYVAARTDLVLAGHTHGGQFRLPFIGGLFAPDQGVFPKYDSGMFTENGTHMIVSRGLGNSSFPFRLNNRPEIVTVILKIAAPKGSPC